MLSKCQLKNQIGLFYGIFAQNFLNFVRKNLGNFISLFECQSCSIYIFSSIVSFNIAKILNFLTGNYSEWMSLKSVDGKIPTQPAVYEMKVWRAKKPAYIGSCENLRQKLTLYNLKQNSGHKQLDKFIDRNYNDIQVRYEVIPAFADAKKEVKARIENFKAVHKNPPAYN